MYPMDSDVGVPGEELWDVCSFCHGVQGQGGPALDAPPLAGMEAWYVKRQLQN
ncbi:MAG: c-type cytochrome, partial [Porticoccaceae bacterium]|nr:c-type cytochrome [Porticoccaceae bacterium]